MAETLKARIGEDIKSAMRAGDKQRLGALRLISAAIKQREVDERVLVDDVGVVALLDKMAKQRRESMDIYAQGGRPDLVEKEGFELGVIQSYMPQPLTDAEMIAHIDSAIAETGAGDIKDMGKVMAVLKPLVQGRCDMAALSVKLKARLS